MKKTTVFMAGFFCSAVMCHAAAIGVSLGQSVESGSARSMLTFSGTLSNSTASTVYLNSAGINLSPAFPPADLDTGPFFANAPLSFGAGASTSNIGLFTIDIPTGLAGGLYQGSFTVLGGGNANAQDTVGTANFTVQVAVPEPGSAVLVGLVIALFACRRCFRTVFGVVLLGCVGQRGCCQVSRWFGPATDRAAEVSRFWRLRQVRRIRYTRTRATPAYVRAPTEEQAGRRPTPTARYQHCAG